MIKLPISKKSFEYENNFYLSCKNDRISKFLAHYELFKLSQNTSGDIVECGIFKGVSFTRFATFCDLFEKTSLKRIIGFDTFGKFPKNQFKLDKKPRTKFLSEAGEQSISEKQLNEILVNKGIKKKVVLVKGDITKTIPKFVKQNPKLKISLLNLDVDMYEPSKTILEELYPKITKGGILILDDYKTWPGETKAVDEYFKDKKIKIKKLPFAKSPYYIIKK
jgi:hypothetical protein